MRISIFSFFCIFLITGNFWIYPEKYGNGWDCSLKVLPYFEINKNFVNYIESEKIDPKKIATGFPLFNDFKFSYLEPNSFKLTDKNKHPLNEFSYILQSNICNDFTQKEIEELNNNWIFLKEFRKGQIYFKFYSKIK
jgi:hypothetical protein